MAIFLRKLPYWKNAIHFLTIAIFPYWNFPIHQRETWFANALGWSLTSGIET